MIRIALLIALFAGPALAQPEPRPAQKPCGDHASIVARLGERYGELMTGSGLQDDLLVEHYANPSTGTWTVLVVEPGGQACAVAWGQSWTSITPGVAL